MLNETHTNKLHHNISPNHLVYSIHVIIINSLFGTTKEEEEEYLVQENPFFS